MRLPADWNGRFLHQVNGGNDGEVLPATGDQPRARASGGDRRWRAASRCFRRTPATRGADPANSPLGLAAGAASASTRRRGATTAMPPT